MTGVEALVRWQYPKLGLVSPIEFIPLAEETSIIIALGEWVMMTACRQMHQWEQLYPELTNMSIKCLHASFGNLILQRESPQFCLRVWCHERR